MDVVSSNLNTGDTTAVIAGKALPTTPKGRATRSRIVDVAADLMFEHGAQATTLDDVKRAARVSTSQLSHYFGDKQSLIRSVIERQTSFVLDAQQPWLDHLDSFEALSAWCDANVALLVRNDCEGGCALGSLASELSDVAEDFRVDLVSSLERWRTPIRDGLQRMRDRGELRAEADPEALATSFLAALQGGTLLSQVRRDPEPLRTAANTMLDYVQALRVEAQ